MPLSPSARNTTGALSTPPLNLIGPLLGIATTHLLFGQPAHAVMPYAKNCLHYWKSSQHTFTWYLTVKGATPVPTQRLKRHYWLGNCIALFACRLNMPLRL